MVMCFDLLACQCVELLAVAVDGIRFAKRSVELTMAQWLRKQRIGYVRGHAHTRDNEGAGTEGR
jgi:hypothetical protein